jgi:hypothetical protein
MGACYRVRDSSRFLRNAGVPVRIPRLSDAGAGEFAAWNPFRQKGERWRRDAKSDDAATVPTNCEPEDGVKILRS